MPIRPSSHGLTGRRTRRDLSPCRGPRRAPPLRGGPAAPARGVGSAPWSADEQRLSDQPGARLRRWRPCGWSMNSLAAASAGVCLAVLHLLGRLDQLGSHARCAPSAARCGAGPNLASARSRTCDGLLHGRVGRRVAATALRTSRLDGRPRSVPRILPASGSLMRKLITSTATSVCLRARGTPTKYIEARAHCALRVTRVGDHAELVLGVLLQLRHLVGPHERGAGLAGDHELLGDVTGVALVDDVGGRGRPSVAGALPQLEPLGHVLLGEAELACRCRGPCPAGAARPRTPCSRRSGPWCRAPCAGLGADARSAQVMSSSQVMPICRLAAARSSVSSVLL